MVSTSAGFSEQMLPTSNKVAYVNESTENKVDLCYYYRMGDKVEKTED